MLLGSLRPLGGLFRSSAVGSGPIASSSRVPMAMPAGPSQVRFRSNLAPKKVKYRKSQKGKPTLPIGGSIKGTTLQFGGFGIRLMSAVRLTAAQLTSAQAAVKRKIKPVKGAELFMRVFPDVPVCVKGNETRMGKGKGTFEYWACRVPAGRVIFEVAGGNIREEIARQALKLAQVKMPVATEFINAEAPPRLGDIASHELGQAKQGLKTVKVQPPPTPLAQAVAAREATAAAAAAAAAASTPSA